jgi:hypothetical protein
MVTAPVMTGQTTIKHWSKKYWSIAGQMLVVGGVGGRPRWECVQRPQSGVNQV